MARKLNRPHAMRGIAIYALLTAVFACIPAMEADGQDTITDRSSVLAADIRDLARKAFMFGLIDENGRDSLTDKAADIAGRQAVTELEAIRMQWEDSLSFLEDLDYDKIFGDLTSDIIDSDVMAEKMLPVLLSIPEMREKFGTLTVEEALERIDYLLGRELAYEKRVASMSKGERIAWILARLLLGGSAPFDPDAIPMMNGLWYMPIPPGKPESFDERLLWDDNFDPRVYKSAIPEPVITPEEMLQGH